MVFSAWRYLWYCCWKARTNTISYVTTTTTSFSASGTHVSLWLYGQVKVGNITILPSKACLHPSGTFYTEDGDPRISGLDWITLASLRDSDNSMMSYSEVDDSVVSGITFWGILTIINSSCFLHNGNNCLLSPFTTAGWLFIIIIDRSHY